MCCIILSDATRKKLGNLQEYQPQPQTCQNPAENQIISTKHAQSSMGSNQQTKSQRHHIGTDYFFAIYATCSHMWRQISPSSTAIFANMTSATIAHTYKVQIDFLSFHKLKVLISQFKLKIWIFSRKGKFYASYYKMKSQKEQIYKDSHHIQALHHKKALKQTISELNLHRGVKSQNSDFFQSFSYTDQFTNNTFLLDCSIKIQQKYNNDLKNELKSSINLISSTRKFHLNSLKQKNYRHIKIKNIETKNLDNQNKVQKYLVRKKKERQSYNKSKLELTRILSKNKQCLYTSANNSMTHTPRSNQFEDLSQLNKMKIQMAGENQLKSNPDDIINELERSFREQKQKKSKRRRQNKKMTEVHLNTSAMTLQQINLVQKIDQELHSEIVKSGQYLILPKPRRVSIVKMSKQNNKRPKQTEYKDMVSVNKIFAKRSVLRNIVSDKNDRIQEKQPQKLLKIPNKYKQLGLKQELSKYYFKSEEEQSVLSKYKLQKYGNTIKDKKKVKGEQKIVIEWVKQGKFLKVEIELALHHELIHTKQPNNENNLLHLSIKYNQPQIFVLVIRKSKQYNVDLFNLPNKYNKTPAQLCKIYKAFYDKCKLLEKNLENLDSRQ